VESTTKIPCDYIFLVKSFVYPPSIFHTIFHTTYRNAIPTTPEIPCSFLNRIYPDLYFLLLSDFNDEKLPFCCLEYFYIFFFFSFLFFSLPWQRWWFVCLAFQKMRKNCSNGNRQRQRQHQINIKTKINNINRFGHKFTCFNSGIFSLLPIYYYLFIWMPFYPAIFHMVILFTTSLSHHTKLWLFTWIVDWL